MGNYCFSKRYNTCEYCKGKNNLLQLLARISKSDLTKKLWKCIYLNNPIDNHLNNYLLNNSLYIDISKEPSNSRIYKFFCDAEEGKMSYFYTCKNCIIKKLITGEMIENISAPSCLICNMPRFSTRAIEIEHVVIASDDKSIFAMNSKKNKNFGYIYSISSKFPVLGTTSQDLRNGCLRLAGARGNISSDSGTVDIFNNYLKIKKETLDYFKFNSFETSENIKYWVCQWHFNNDVLKSELNITYLSICIIDIISEYLCIPKHFEKTSIDEILLAILCSRPDYLGVARLHFN